MREDKEEQGEVSHWEGVMSRQYDEIIDEHYLRRRTATTEATCKQTYVTTGNAHALAVVKKPHIASKYTCISLFDGIMHTLIALRGEWTHAAILAQRTTILTNTMIVTKCTRWRAHS